MADNGNVATSVSEPEEHPGPSPLSILDALKAKAPTHTQLTRMRKIDCNPPPKEKRRARGERSSEPKKL